MSFTLIPFASAAIEKQAVQEVLCCNGITQRFGLTLTQAQAVELVQTRAFSLRQNGRIEFGGGAIDKIITAFCDSPFLSMHNYTQTLHELVELFYAYKNEAMDLIGDDDLITFMKAAYDGVCQGSLELLGGRELDQLARNLRSGRAAGAAEQAADEEDDDEHEE